MSLTCSIRELAGIELGAEIDLTCGKGSTARTSYL